MGTFPSACPFVQFSWTLLVQYIATSRLHWTLPYPLGSLPTMTTRPSHGLYLSTRPHTRIGLVSFTFSFMCWWIIVELNFDCGYNPTHRCVPSWYPQCRLCWLHICGRDPEPSQRPCPQGPALSHGRASCWYLRLPLHVSSPTPGDCAGVEARGLTWAPWRLYISDEHFSHGSWNCVDCCRVATRRAMKEVCIAYLDITSRLNPSLNQHLGP